MRNRIFGISGVIFSVFILLASGAANAAVITVNTVDDELGIDTGTADGDCSLREAVQAINNQAAVDACVAGDGNDTITFAPALMGQTIVLDLTGAQEDNNASGDLDIFTTIASGSIVITGPGNTADSIIIDGGANLIEAIPDRMFHIQGSENTALLEFSNLTLQNGSVGDGEQQTFSPGGGAILAQYDGELPRQIAMLRFLNTTVNQNVARGDFASGGGVNVDTVDVIDVDNSAFTGNTLQTTNSGAGGGFAVRQAGPVDITNSVFNGNSLFMQGGNAFGGGLAIGDSNTFSNGGGAESLTVGQSEFSDNIVSGSTFTGADFPSGASGGGLAVSNVVQALTVTNSNFDQNTLEADSGLEGGVVTGGGFFVGSAGSAAFVDSTFDENSATMMDGDVRGGGLFVGSSNSSVSVNQGSVSNNSATTVQGQAGRGGNAQGGGLWTGTLGQDLVLVETEITGNSLSASGVNAGMAQGGGIYAESVSSATFDGSRQHLNSVSASNGASGGGAWLGSANQLAVFIDTEFTANSITASNALGGGLYIGGTASPSSNVGNVTVRNSLLVSNSLTATDSNAHGAGFWLSSAASMTVEDSEFSNNAATTQGVDVGEGIPPSAFGGGLYIDGPDCPDTQACMQIRNTTISGNALTAAQSRADGAGLFLLSAFTNSFASLNNVTIADNSISANTPRGGGFAVADGVVLQLSNSLIATNTATVGPDCATSISGGQITVPGNVVSNGYNLIGVTDSCEFAATTGDITGNAEVAVDPLITALGNNGGATFTHQLLAGSPAIDAGNPETPSGANASCETTDQRGETRPRDGVGNGTAQCDIGALERMANAPPTVVDAIPDQTLQANDDDVSVDLTTVFSDPEEGPLTFSAVSSNTSSVLASVDGNSLMISPLGNGVATVTVTATDEFGGSTDDTVTVTVTNQPPTVDSPIPDQNYSANGSPQSFDLSMVFSDPESDPLTFVASSSDSQVVTTAVDANTLTVTPGAVGTATVSVTAIDDLEAGTTDTFNVEVTVDNLPPNLVQPIPDQSLRAGSDAVTFDLNQVFSDPEEGALAFSVVSSDPEVASVAINAGILSITALQVGNVMVDVTASDPMQLSTIDNLLVEVTIANQAPAILSQIPDQTLSAAGNASIDLSQVFQDPDGDPLFFSAISSNTDVVVVDISEDGVLLLTAGVPGTATITVTAQDTLGAQVLLRAKINGDSGANFSSGGGGCVMTAHRGGAVDPTLWVLLLFSALWWFRSRRGQSH